MERTAYSNIRIIAGLVLTGLILIFFGACSKPKVKIKKIQSSSAGKEADLERFSYQHIGAPVGDKPWIGHLKAMDLDQDGRMDIVACESKVDEVFWLRQTATGGFEEILLADDMRAPVHVEDVDMDKDGDLDLLVSSMSVVFPNNDKIGAIFILENDGKENFRHHLIIENIDRVVDARAADFNGDGELDLAVGQFGYDQGEIRWMKRIGPWEFESQVLLELSGTINVCVADFNGDRTLDMAGLVSQQWEEVHLFLNDGKGNFTNKVIWGSTNEEYSCSGMSLCDLNRDGRADLVFSNGDGFGPTPQPGPKPWHGIQWLENMGNGYFRFQRIGDLGGAYAPVQVDLDHDGDMDVVALSSFNDWTDPNSESLVWFENDGYMRFTLKVLSRWPTHLLTVDVADFDGSGDYSIVTGGFHAYPPYDRMSRLLIWRPNKSR